MQGLQQDKILLFLTINQRLFRDAVLFDLLQQKDIEFAGESSFGAETLERLEACGAKSLIIEENLPDIDGLTISEMALSRNPALSIILLVDQPIGQHRHAIYFDAGIKSVVSKTQSIQLLTEAIFYTRGGQRYVNVDMVNVPGTMKTDQQRMLQNADIDKYSSLSEREQEVAYHIAKLTPLSEIATQLNISNKTIHTYKERIFVKLGIQRLPELVVYMKRLSLCQHFDRSSQ